MPKKNTLTREPEDVTVVDLSLSKKEAAAIKLETIRDTVREEAQEFAKNFKTSWLKLGRHLFSIHQDRMYNTWGFEKFEDYAEGELGLPKSLCQKLLKAYLFIEQEEPVYLEKDFASERDALRVSHYDGIDVLRLAKTKKELLVRDYQKLRHDVFERGVEPGEVRKDLTALMKERKPVDPEEEREKRQGAMIKKFLTALDTFRTDALNHLLVPDAVIEQMSTLKKELEKIKR